MAGFKGRAEYSVDNKGRVAIPAKMRSALTPEARSTFIITRGFDQCVYLYPQDRWEQLEVEIRNLNPFQVENRSFIRGMLMWAEDVTLDAQGRIGVPKELLSFGGIEDKTVILGALDHIELWNPERFNEYYEAQASDYEGLAERVMKGAHGAG